VALVLNLGCLGGTGLSQRQRKDERDNLEGTSDSVLHVHLLCVIQRFGEAANGPTSGLACVFANGPSSAATPRAIAAVSLAFWKQVKSGRSRHANGPHSRLPALMAASCTILIARS